MNEGRKGFYFSFDALIALLLLLTGFFIMQSGFGTDRNQSRISDYVSSDTAAEDAIQSMSEMSFSDSFNESFTQQVITETSLEEEDLHRTVLESVAILWASDDTEYAGKVSRAFLDGMIEEKYGYSVVFEDETRERVFSRGDSDGSDVIGRAVRMVSGVERDRPTRGFIAKASLGSVGGERSEFAYYGGFVGNGNITTNLTLPVYQNIVSAELEGDFGGDFNLSVNGVEADAFEPEKTNLSSNRWVVCNSSIRSEVCESFEPGSNRIKYSFTGNGSSIGGGFMKVSYNRSQSLQTGSGNYTVDRKNLHGIRGVINTYSSLTVPGTLHSISGNIDMKSDLNISLDIGNATVWTDDALYRKTFSISNETVFEAINASGMSYRQMSNSTVPFRIGVEDIESLRSEGTDDTDSGLIIDVSGSMDYDPDYDGTTLLDEAKEASNTFIDSVLNHTNNRVGLVSYESSVDTIHQLSQDNESLKNTVDGFEAGGNTCIGCGILTGIDMMDTPKWDGIIGKKERWRWKSNVTGVPEPQEGTEWYQRGYDDSEWEEDRAIIGFSSEVDTVVEDHGGDMFFRKTFGFDKDGFNDFMGMVRSDDAAEVYINGKLVDNDTGRHSGEYWNRYINGITPVFKDIFDREDTGEDWEVISGNEGDEVKLGRECGAYSGDKALITRWGGGEVESKVLDTSEAENLSLSYAVKQGGSSGCDRPEDGEDLYVQYLDSTGSWQSVNVHRGNGDDPSPGSWKSYEPELPQEAYHDGLRIRFSFPSGSGEDYDYWAVDDVRLGEYLEENYSVLRDGRNVVAARLKNGERPENLSWVTDTEEEWNRGSFNNTTVSSANLTLESMSSITPAPVDMNDYCSNTGGTTYYGEYIDKVEFNGISSQTGDNGGYFDGTDQVSDKLVPGKTYTLEVTFGTSGYEEHASVIFDWDGDGDMKQVDTIEVGSCSSDGCTVSTDITVPDDAVLGNTLMRVMGEWGGYHKKPCDEPFYNEVEDYTVYVDEERYVSEGSYRSEMFDAGIEVNWTKADIEKIVPDNTSFSINYSNGTHWFDSVEEIGTSRNLEFRANLSTSNPSTTPQVDSINITYLSDTAEFDFGMNASSDRNRSMIVMSDGEANVDTSMNNVPDHNNDGTVDARDHTIEAGCRAWEDHGIRVYTVGFGDNADEETLNLTAQCGNAEYFFAETGELADTFVNISEQVTVAAQEITASSGINQTLFPNSYIDLNYSESSSRDYGEFVLEQESDRFGGNISSPKNGSFTVPGATEVKEARLVTYSSRYWVDRVLMFDEVWEHVFRLWDYGDSYQKLGDPYEILLHVEKISEGVNNISVDTAVSRNRRIGGSPDSRVIYELLVEGFAGYGEVFTKAEGGTTTVQTDYGDSVISVGNSSDSWEPDEDAVDNATERLFEKMDVDGDGVVDFRIDDEDLEIDRNVLEGLRWLWGPSKISLEVWKR